MKSFFLRFVAALLLTTVAFAQTPALNWSTIDGGGGTSTGGAFALSGTIGQPDAGRMSDSRYAMEGGFWSVLSAGTAIDTQELIVNGSFENTIGTFVPDANGFMSLPVGSNAIPGWSITSAELAWIGNANPFGVVTPFGAFYLELTGYHDLGAYSAVFQNIVTTPGGNYRLSLALGAYASSPGGGGQKKVLVTAGSASTTLIFNSNLVWPTNTGNLWSTFTFNFTAAAASTRVTILGVPDANTYLGLDNVSVIVAPPEALRITVVGILGTELRLSIPTISGRSYALESRVDLVAGEWTAVPSGSTAGTGATVELSVPVSLTQARQFYRVKQLP